MPGRAGQGDRDGLVDELAGELPALGQAERAADLPRQQEVGPGVGGIGLVGHQATGGTIRPNKAIAWVWTSATTGSHRSAIRACTAAYTRL